MGSCQSHQPVAATVAEENGSKSSVLPRQGESCMKSTTGDDLFHPPPMGVDVLTKEDVPDSAASQGTGMTSMESQELFDAHHDSHRGSPQEEEEFAAIPIPMALTPSEEKIDQGSMAASKQCDHIRKSSEPLKDFFRSMGASSNRIMVHIETPLGVPIEDIYDGVHDGEVLGEGITGKVRLITHKETGIQRALKRLDLGLISNEEDLNSLFEEIKVMCALDHPNIVCLEEVYEGVSELYLTQELCNGGDLFDRLDKQEDLCYTEANCARILRQITSSVSYLHSKNIIHRDMKLENFLFSDETDHSELKMIDFGLSKHFHKGDVQFETVGTPYTVAPEVILGQGYDEKCDIWAIGVLAFLLLSGDTPFGGACEGDDLAQVRENILSGEVTFDPDIWANVSDLAIEFTKSLLILDPEKRPSAEEVQKHPWVVLMKRNSSLEDGEEESYLDKTVVNGLVSYKELSHTRKFLCEVLSFTLQPDQLAGLREEFEKMDVEGKGEISLACFKEALHARSGEHQMSEAEIEEIFDGLKVRNTDLSIRWHEFIAACLSQCHVDDRNIRLAFDRLDSDHKGYITLEDLKSAMDFYHSSRGDLQVMWINNVIDYKNDKDHMTYDDFYKLLKLDRQSGSTKQLLSRSAPPTTAASRASSRKRRVTTNNSLLRSYVRPAANIDQDLLDSVAMDDLEISNHGRRCKRELTFPPFSFDEPELLSNMKAYRNMQDVLLGASKRAAEVNSPMSNGVKRKNSVSGTTGLLLRRASQDNLLLLQNK